MPLFNGDGQLIGALGVSGGTPEQDAVLARAAIA
ncbi:heme-binding protein [Burkholderia sp. E168m23]|nr:heme-binding protein [Burkholderia sp. E168m23]